MVVFQLYLLMFRPHKVVTDCFDFDSGFECHPKKKKKIKPAQNENNKSQIHMKDKNYVRSHDSRFLLSVKNVLVSVAQKKKKIKNCIKLNEFDCFDAIQFLFSSSTHKYTILRACILCMIFSIQSLFLFCYVWLFSFFFFIFYTKYFFYFCIELF